MSQSPLISVIIPIYNVEKYLPECVGSVLAQTYKNLEIILVDDGSTDGCPKLCDEYAAEDKRVKSICKPNSGVSDTRNAGLGNVSGEYICFVDSDDWVAPDMIEFLYNNLVAHDVDISCCGLYRSYVGLDLPRSCEEPLVLTGKEAVMRRFDGRFISSLCTRLYKKHIFDNIRFPAGKIYEDAWAVVDFFMAADRIYFAPDPKYYYRIRKSSLTHSLDYISEVMDPLEMMEDRQRNISEKYPDFVSIGEAYLYRRYIRVLADIRINKEHRKTPEGKKSVSLILKKLEERTPALLKNTHLNKNEKRMLRLLNISEQIFITAQTLSAYRRSLKKHRRRKKEGTDNTKKLVLYD